MEYLVKSNIFHKKIHKGLLFGHKEYCESYLKNQTLKLRSPDTLKFSAMGIFVNSGFDIDVFLFSGFIFLTEFLKY